MEFCLGKYEPENLLSKSWLTSPQIKSGPLSDFVNEGVFNFLGGSLNHPFMYGLWLLSRY